MGLLTAESRGYSLLPRLLVAGSVGSDAQASVVAAPWAALVVAHGLRVRCGIFLDLGSEAGVPSLAGGFLSTREVPPGSLDETPEQQVEDQHAPSRLLAPCANCPSTVGVEGMYLPGLFRETRPMGWIVVALVAQLSPTLCNSMDRSMLGFPDLHHLPELGHIRGMTRPRRHASAQSPPQGPQYLARTLKVSQLFQGLGLHLATCSVAKECTLYFVFS